MTDGDVIAQRTGDQRMMRIAVAGVGREQDLLFKPEVPTSVDRPEGR
jgi:hypothetical protein